MTNLSFVLAIGALSSAKNMHEALVIAATISAFGIICEVTRFL